MNFVGSPVKSLQRFDVSEHFTLGADSQDGNFEKLYAENFLLSYVLKALNINTLSGFICTVKNVGILSRLNCTYVDRYVQLIQFKPVQSREF